MVYKEIEPEVWKYEKDGDAIEGVLVNVDEDVGPNKSKLYYIENEDGIKNVWGSTILDSRMLFVKIGDKIKITYNGLAEPTSGKNPAKIFKVEVDKEEFID